MTKWIVDGLIPEGHVVLFLGQPHSTKSRFLEQLAICVASGHRFLGYEGFAVTQGSVLLIDEDTPTDTLEQRLNRLALGSGVDISNLPFEYRSMNGFLLNDNRQLINLEHDIGQMQPPVVVILDSLSSMMGRWSENSSSDALKAAKSWQELKSTKATILIAHHMSLKKRSSYQDFEVGS